MSDDNPAESRLTEAEIALADSLAAKVMEIALINPDVLRCALTKGHDDPEKKTPMGYRLLVSQLAYYMAQDMVQMRQDYHKAAAKGKTLGIA